MPDGEQQSSGSLADCPDLPPVSETNIKARPALKSKTFWLLSIVFAWHMLVMNATIIHVMPYLTSIGVIRSRSSLVATSVPLMSIIGRLGLGWLGDRFSTKTVTAWGFSFMGIGLLCFGYSATAGPWLLILFVIMFGIGYGGTNTLKPALIRQYFGRGSFGTLFGLIMGITTIGGIAGAPMAGFTYDTWGNYQGIWFLFAGLSIVAIVLVLAIRPPQIEKGAVDIPGSGSP
jgi:MFS family permease